MDESSSSSDEEMSLNTSTASGTSDGRKGSRPMPASARKRLEESKVSNNDDSSNDVSKSKSEDSVQRKSSRPMPASVRKKLESQKSDNSPRTDLDDSNSTLSKNDVTPVVKQRPMPASARRKLEESASSSSNKFETSSVSEEKKPNKPMPASVRRKLNAEEVKSLETSVPSPTAAENISGSSSSVVSASSKRSSSRPMPASAKRKIETKSDDGYTVESDNEKTEHVSQKTDVDLPKKSSRPMPASAKRKLDEGVTNQSKTLESECVAAESNSVVNKGTSDANKINISLGGIKFPSFSKPKPMPASARRKLEEEQKSETDDTKQFKTIATSSSSCLDDGSNKDEQRSSKPEKLKRELKSLEQTKHACQYCGMEFYQLSKKNNHEKLHLRKESDEKKESTRVEKDEVQQKKPHSKPGPKKHAKSKIDYNKVCPHCNKRISNRKKLYRHVYKCGLPLKFSCTRCDKKFKFERELILHSTTHTDSPPAMNDSGSEEDGGAVDRHSSISEKSRHSDSISTSMAFKQRSIKEKVEREVESTGKVEVPSKRTSFKRKIDEVLDNLSNPISHVGKAIDSEEEKVEPPRKKKMGATDCKKESSSRRAMPASIRKKLEEEESKKGTKEDEQPKLKVEKEEEKRDEGDDDDEECEVCHRVFSSSRKRQKHEKTVHFIEKPRGWKEEPSSTINDILAPVTPSSVVSSQSMKPKTIDDVVSSSSAVIQQSKVEITTPTSVEKKKMVPFSAVPNVGQCPICDKFLPNRLKRHVINVHFKGNREAAMSSTFKSTKKATNTPSSSTSKDIKPLKILSPGYQRTFKMYKTNRSKSEKKTETSQLPSTSISDEPSYKDDDKETFLDEQQESVPSPEDYVDDDVSPDSPDIPVPSPKIQKTEENMPAKKSETKVQLEPLPKEKTLSKLTSANYKFQCVSCDEAFLAKADYEEHLKENHPQMKLVLSCTICKSMFTQEDDFVLHMKYRHTEVANELEKSIYRIASESHSQKNALSPDHNSMDTSYNDNDDDDYEPESSSTTMETQEPTIAITSTFSQNQQPTSTTQEDPSKDLSSHLNEMPCSSCDEKFYNFEALRKHELYFHNKKTVRMCPICGVYPVRLGRHLIAHENKTVRCSCAPCGLHFNEFSDLLKHNLEKHPGPNGGALSAPNRSRELIQTSTSSKASKVEDEGVHACTLCHKEFMGAAQTRRHIRGNHEGEFEEPAQNYVVKVGEEKAKETEDATKGNEAPLKEVTEVSAPTKPKRPMPASVRAKLESQQIKTDNQNCNTDKITGTPSSSSKKARPMPASVRAKLEMNNSKAESPTPVPTDDSKPTPKLNRPLPASVRAKLMAEQQQQSSSLATSSSETKTSPVFVKPNRPMPASVRAKLKLAQSETSPKVNSKESCEVAKKVDDEPEILMLKCSGSKSKGNQQSTCHEVIDLDDDDDDDVIVEQDLSFPQPELISHPDEDFIPIDHDHDIEHEKAVKITDDNHSSSMDMNFRCKMCERIFETRDGARRHILRVHNEYGSEHTENLIDIVYEDPKQEKSTRKRSSLGKYEKDEDYVVKEDEEDEDDEVIIPRGTTRRPRRGSSSTPKDSKLEQSSTNPVNQWGYACKVCQQRKETPGNVRRHICKSHPQIPANQRDDFVIHLDVEEDQDHESDPEMETVESEPLLELQHEESSASETSYRGHLENRNTSYQQDEVSTSISGATPVDVVPPKKYRPGPASRKSKLLISSTSSLADQPVVSESSGDNQKRSTFAHRERNRAPALHDEMDLD